MYTENVLKEIDFVCIFLPVIDFCYCM